MCLDLFEEEWDIAIVLDACRFDFFQKLYKNYLPSGRLEKKIGAPGTSDWLKTLFGSYRDIVYVSAHAGVNNAGVSWHGWCAQGKFLKLYDAWLDGWDEKTGAINPEHVIKIAMQAINENPGKKLLIHFGQPHTPYRQAPYLIYDKPDANKKTKSLPAKFLLFNKIRSLSGLFIEKYGLVHSHRKLRKFFNLKPKTPEEYYETCFSHDELFSLYEDNLKWVLENISSFIRQIQNKKLIKKIVVTSDHGEALGERGEFWHGIYLKSSVVREVPFYSVELHD